ncbi:MAG TPA: 1-deoxy-D-xylulose-5-phosphate reductoisomerase [Candidatus Fraserbacteria bacterium]|nr:1-deoxy-D-xylulose-5-phosphate reductoisomerase [Candidatus Fraserbacteria bacterium]
MHTSPKRVALLGSTGSIGTQALQVISELNRQGMQFEVVALAAGHNLTRLLAQIRRWQPQFVSLADEQALDSAQERLGRAAGQIEWLAGASGLERAATGSSADLVLNGLVGALGLRPTLAALEAGINVALANKESLVIGGSLIRQACRRGGARLIPVDSEHSAIFQLLAGRPAEEIASLILTASGGALRDWPLDKLAQARPEQVLRHPNWHMGQRITVDSATLVNKGLEIIEAHWLFGLPYEQLCAIIQPQSLVHGLIELCDGTLLAQLGAADMRLPLQYALTYPERQANPWPRLALAGLSLELQAIDPERHPAFFTLVEAGRRGGSAPAALNAADEVLVERFLRGEIAFTQIAAGLARLLQELPTPSHREPSLPELLAADAQARRLVAGW